jgi:RimJ/RimL family protein N-acetyltransferase
MPYPERVETPRLLLRRWRPGDAPAMAAIWADPDVRLALSPSDDEPSGLPAATLARQLGHWERHGFGLWAALPRGHGDASTPADEPIGWIGAWYPDFVPELLGEIEIAWTLRRPWWGRGLAAEGARAAAAVVFEHRRPPRVISLIAPGNDRSTRVAQRIGMRRQGDALTDRGMTLGVYSLARG